MENINFPDWYKSTSGPGTSQTIANIAGAFLPMLNMVLESHGTHLLPEVINTYISVGVFLVFTVRAMIGYVRAKKLMGSRIANLESQLRSVGVSRP